MTSCPGPQKWEENIDSFFVFFFLGRVIKKCLVTFLDFYLALLNGGAAKIEQVLLVIRNIWGRG